MKRLILIACLVLGLVGSIALLIKRGRVAAPPASRDALLLLLGVTNLPAGSFAVFCLSNSTGTAIACVPEAFEQSSAGSWVRTPLAGSPRGAVRDWIGVPEELDAGKAVSFMVTPPTTNGTWRVVFMCQERARWIDPVTDAGRHLIDTNAAQVQDRQFSGRRYYVRSPEVEP